MKKIFTVLALCATLMLSARNRAEGQEFTICGEISGLAVGDTLRFERIELPDWNLTHAFDVVVSIPGRFEYSGQHPDTEYYMMTYLPLVGEANGMSKGGQTMIVGGGVVTISGNIGRIYFCRIEGEAFGDQPLLREAAELEDAFELERWQYMKGMDETHASGDLEKNKEYTQKYTELTQSDKPRRIAELKRKFLRENPSSVWSMVQRLESAPYTPVDTLETYYTRLDAPASESRFGMELRKMIDALARLRPGEPAPGFSVTLPDGTVMNSDDFRGKYLLIYHWGFCPGSIQLEKEVTDFYNRFKEHIEILGITDSLEEIREAARTTENGATMFGVDLKGAYESMAAHPWIDAEDVGDNKKIGESYIFAGYPFFVLVSPDGKIVSRGFHETFFEAKKIIEAQHQQ